MIKLLPIKVFTFICTLLFCTTYAQKNPMHPKNEFRAVWIATVANIDWPKNGKDAIEKQKIDYIELLDTYKKLNFNAVIVQIRSVGDAFYCTNMAPWSKYLTGEEGKAPKPYYDPLEWMITQAHKRGFEFHAWLNPFRATNDSRTNLLSPTHDLNKHPEWMIKYGDKYFYNPALPEVQDHLIKVVEEVVQNYDIDAIHFDDYFYPYEIKGQTFDDSDSYKKYGEGLKLEDWRRLNVNKYIKNNNDAIKKIKPWVQFGISPFGVWRNKSDDPKGSETRAGQTNYDHLFADPLEWMEKKSIDYILPQLYWSLDHPLASYAVLAKWWSENSPNTALYLGNSSYKINNDADKSWTNPNEMANQVNLSRTFPNILGHGYFSAKWFMNANKDVTDILANNQYKYPALPLAVPNLKKKLTIKPQIKSFQKDSVQTEYTLIYPDEINIRYLMVYQARTKAEINTEDATQIFDKIFIYKKEKEFIIALKNTDNIYALSFTDYYGNETAATILDNKLFIDKSLKIYKTTQDSIKTNTIVKVVDTVKPVEVVKPSEPTKVVEPIKTPTKPVEVVKPAEPTKVVEPVKTPTKVVETVKTPTKPVEVEKPVEPVKVKKKRRCFLFGRRDKEEEKPATEKK